MLAAQTQLYTYICNFLQNSTTKIAVEKRTTFHFESRIKLLDNYWSEFFDQNDSLEQYRDDDDFSGEDYFKGDNFCKGAMTYVSTRATLLEELSRAEAASVTIVHHGESNNTQASGNLMQSLSNPVWKVTVPTLSGEQRDWEHFKGMFEAVIIKDQRIPPIVKLEHLMSSCTGKAGQVLKGA